MKVQLISFRCHQNTKEQLRDYGKVVRDMGYINGKKLEIYSAYSRTGKLIHKLYYLSDAVGHWIKSKLKYYDENGKCFKVLRSSK